MPGSKQMSPDPGGTTTPFYQCIKTSIKSVVRDDTVIVKVQDAPRFPDGALSSDNGYDRLA